jgi:hypothetical protein
MAAIGATNCTFIESGALKFLISDSPTDSNLPVQHCIFCELKLYLASHILLFVVLLEGDAEAQNFSPCSCM